jgi:hypothetical protein
VKLFHWLRKTGQTEQTIPPPLLGRVGHVGGIEALSLDGVLLFFGFDYKSDLVLSPLIDDADLMARFASLHMRQRDGAHDADYWLLYGVDLAREYSDLCSDEEDRTFDSAQLRAALAQLQQAATGNQDAPDMNISYHLLYLLAAAGGWKADADVKKMDEDLRHLVGEAPLPAGQTFADISWRLLAQLNALLAAAPDNWATRFAMLNENFQRARRPVKP